MKITSFTLKLLGNRGSVTAIIEQMYKKVVVPYLGQECNEATQGILACPFYYMHAIYVSQ